MTYYIVFHTKFDHEMHYLWGKITYICTFKCHPTSAQPRNFRRIPQNSTGIFSAEFLKELKRYFRTFPQNVRTFPQNGKIVRKFAEETTLYGNVWNCKEIGEKKTLYENVRKSDRVEI